MTKIKTYADFENTLLKNAPNNEWSEALKALWYDAKGDWKASHDIAQDMNNDLGSWIHGYLHRKEGDAFNAGYWYRKARQEFPKIPLAQEHRAITEFVLDAD